MNHIDESSDRHDTLWQSTGPAYPALDRDLDVDVAIVGAGITGITLALLLREAGVDVAVFELGTVGGGATGRTTGHLTTALDTPYNVLRRRFGDAATSDAARMSSAAIDFIETRAHGIPCDFQRVDGWRYTEPGASSTALQAERDAARAIGIPVDLHPSGPLAFMGPALRFPNQARFHPLAWLHGLAHAYTKAGGKLYEHTRVDTITEGERCVLESGGHTVRAAHVVHATHIPIGLALPLQARVASYQTYVIAAQIDGPVPPELYWDTARPYHYLRSVALPQGRAAVIIGGEDHRTGNQLHARDRFAALETYAQSRFPGVRVLHRWSGRVLEPADGLPYIGRIGEHRNVYGATGFGGNGLTYGTVAGLHLAGLILGTSDTTSVFRPQRFQPFATMRSLVRENATAAWRELRGQLATPERSGLEHVKPGTGEILTVEGVRTAVFRATDGSVHLMSPLCPHDGAVVQWNDAARTWDCPLGGSRFHATGALLAGPARSDLATDEASLSPGAEASMPALLETLHHQGYACEVTPHLGGRITCESCGTQADATEGTIDAFHRFEGVSDPDDVCLVVALRLPHPDGECRGVLVLGFGPSASAEDKSVLSSLNLGSRIR